MITIQRSTSLSVMFALCLSRACLGASGCDAILVPTLDQTHAFSSVNIAYASSIDATTYSQIMQQAGAEASILGAFGASASYSDFQTNLSRYQSFLGYNFSGKSGYDYLRTYLPDSVQQRWLDCKKLEAGGPSLLARPVFNNVFLLRVLYTPQRNQTAPVAGTVQLSGCQFQDDLTTQRSLTFNGIDEKAIFVSVSDKVCQVAASASGFVDDLSIPAPSAGDPTLHFYLRIYSAAAGSGGYLNLEVNDHSVDPYTSTEITPYVMERLLAGTPNIEVRSEAVGPGWQVKYDILVRAIQRGVISEQAVCSTAIGYAYNTRRQTCPLPGLLP